MKSKKEFKKFVEQNESIRELQSKIEKDWKKKEEVKLLENDGYEVEIDDIKDVIKEVFLEMKEKGELTNWIKSLLEDSLEDIKKEGVFKNELERYYFLNSNK